MSKVRIESANVQKTNEIKEKYPQIWNDLDFEMNDCVDYFYRYVNHIIGEVLKHHMNNMSADENLKFIQKFPFPLAKVEITFDFYKLYNYEKKKSKKN